MSRTNVRQPAARKGSGYHHGQLREALLEAAQTLIEHSGVEALTLREVARRAGVSTAAPYHHFADKAELVRTLAQHSLIMLDQASAEAVRGIVDPREKLQSLGITYVLFAVDHPADFRLMFRPEIGSPFAQTEPSETPVFRHLLAVIGELHAYGFGRGDVQHGAIAAWSLVHGLASLLVDGPLHNLAGEREQVRALAEQITATLLHG